MLDQHPPLCEHRPHSPLRPLSKKSTPRRGLKTRERLIAYMRLLQAGKQPTRRTHNGGARKRVRLWHSAAMHCFAKRKLKCVKNNNRMSSRRTSCMNTPVDWMVTTTVALLAPYDTPTMAAPVGASCRLQASSMKPEELCIMA